MLLEITKMKQTCSSLAYFCKALRRILVLAWTSPLGMWLLGLVACTLHLHLILGAEHSGEKTTCFRGLPCPEQLDVEALSARWCQKMIL